MRSETSVGVLTWVLAAIAVAGLRRGGRARWTVAAGALLVLTLGPQLRATGTWLTDVAMPYRWLYELVPPLRAGRDPTRLFPLALLSLAILAAFGVRDLLARRSDIRRTRIGFLLVALAIFESLVVWRPMLAPVTPAVYDELAETPDRGPIVDLNGNLMGMLGQTVHGRPLGYVWGIDLRAAPRLQEFRVEQLFMQPRLVLDVGTPERERALADLRERIRSRPVDRLVFPSSPISNRQARLARLLGASVSSRGGYSTADLTELSAPR